MTDCNDSQPGDDSPTAQPEPRPVGLCGAWGCPWLSQRACIECLEVPR